MVESSRRDALAFSRAIGSPTRSRSCRPSAISHQLECRRPRRELPDGRRLLLLPRRGASRGGAGAAGVRRAAAAQSARAAGEPARVRDDQADLHRARRRRRGAAPLPGVALEPVGQHADGLDAAAPPADAAPRPRGAGARRRHAPARGPAIGNGSLVAQIARGAAEPPTALPLLLQLDLVATAFVPEVAGEAAAGSTLPVIARAWSPEQDTLAGDEPMCAALLRRAATALAVAQPLRLAEAVPVHVVGAAVGGRAQLQVEAAQPVRRRARSASNSAQFAAIRRARRNSTAPPPPTDDRLQAHAAVRPPRRAVGAVGGPRPARRPRAAGERLLTMEQTRKLLPLGEGDPKAFEVPLVGVWVAGTADAAAPLAWPPPRASLRCAIRGAR